MKFELRTLWLIVTNTTSLMKSKISRTYSIIWVIFLWHAWSTGAVEGTCPIATRFYYTISGHWSADQLCSKLQTIPLRSFVAPCGTLHQRWFQLDFLRKPTTFGDSVLYTKIQKLTFLFLSSSSECGSPPVGFFVPSSFQHLLSSDFERTVSSFFRSKLALHAESTAAVTFWVVGLCLYHHIERKAIHLVNNPALTQRTQACISLRGCFTVLFLVILFQF